MTAVQSHELEFCPEVAILGIAAWSGTGKTTLLESLLPRLKASGLRVAVIKHAHHRFDVDQPGKDSHRLRQAGAMPMLVASSRRYALMMETPEAEEADLAMLIRMVMPTAPDLILVEGFKDWPLPKLELYRPALGQPLLASRDSWVRAIASDVTISEPDGVAELDLNDHDTIAAWIRHWVMTWPDTCSTLTSHCRIAGQEPSARKEPSAGQEEPSAGQREPSAGQRELSADKEEPSAGQEEPSAGQEEPS